MKRWRELPGFASIPRENCMLNSIAGALLILTGAAGLLVEAGIGTGACLAMAAAGVLLLLMYRKGNPVVLYRWSCVLLAAGFWICENSGLMLAALLIFLCSFNLRSNPKLENVPAWMSRPVWSLVLTVFVGVLAFDYMLFVISCKYFKLLVMLLPAISLLLMCLAAESVQLPNKQKQPRLQSVPAGGKIYDIAMLLLLVYVVMYFFQQIKAAVGVPATQFIQVALANPQSMKIFFTSFIRLVPDVAALALLINGKTRREAFPMAVFLLAMTRVGADFELYSAMIPLVILLLAAVGVTWNKPVGKKGLSVVSLILVIALAIGMVAATVDVVGASKSEAASARRSIEKQVLSAAEDAVFEELTGKTRGKGKEISSLDPSSKYERKLEKASDKISSAVYDAVFSTASELAYEAGMKIDRVEEEQVKSSSEYIAETYADIYSNAYEYMGNYIYEEMLSFAFEMPGELVVAQKLTKADIEPQDMEKQILKAIKKEYSDMSTSRAFGEAFGRETELVSVMEAAVADTVDKLAFDTAFAEGYAYLHEEIYVPCDAAATEAALAELDEHSGEVYKRVMNMVIPYIVDMLLLAALALMCFDMELRAADKLPNRFMEVLHWCYTNVGEKLQRCMKILGGVYLITGAVGAIAIGLAAVFFFRAQFTVAAALLGGGIVCIIVSALNIIMTYPLFAFAQVAADVHHIRGGFAADPELLQVENEEVFEQAEESEENPDGLPEL